MFVSNCLCVERNATHVYSAAIFRWILAMKGKRWKFFLTSFRQAFHTYGAGFFGARKRKKPGLPPWLLDEPLTTLASTTMLLIITTGKTSVSIKLDVALIFAALTLVTAVPII